jgi:hypothetical protein
MFKATDELDRVQVTTDKHVMLTPDGFKKLHTDLEAYAQAGKPLGGFYEGIFELDMKADIFIGFSTGAILIMEKRFKYAETKD